VAEAALPGMSEYIRVRDYREQQLLRMPNVEVFRDSALTADDVRAFGADHVAIATGARWSRLVAQDKVISDVAPGGQVLTPDDIMAGRLPQGRTVVFDGDGYYLGSVLAERIRAAGHAVTLVTPSDSVAYWSRMTGERWRVRTHLMRLGVDIVTAHAIRHFDGAEVTLACAYSGRAMVLPAVSLVMVSHREPVDGLYHSLRAGPLPFTLRRIGDCEAPAIIVAATFAGHAYATEMDAPVDPDQPVRHERIDVGQGG